MAALFGLADEDLTAQNVHSDLSSTVTGYAATINKRQPRRYTWPGNWKENVPWVYSAVLPSTTDFNPFPNDTF